MSAVDPADTFRQEARELLDQLEHGLLDLEQNPADTDLVNSVFRALCHALSASFRLSSWPELYYRSCSAAK